MANTLQATSSSSVCYVSPDKGITILDIPRTLEESQRLPGHETQVTRRILSAQPVTKPFPTPESKHGSSSQDKSPASQIADLMTAASIENALEQIHCNYNGPFCLPRLVAGEDTSKSSSDPYIPENSTYLNGTIQDLSQKCKDDAPDFNLVILDPPWPNRSVRRKTEGYSTVYNIEDMHELLSHVPIRSKLAPDGLVAVWITNKSKISEFLLSPGGLFSRWGLELVTEWTWVKVTAAGEPIFDLNSTWRKPWEKLLIAKRVGAASPVGLQSKIIIAVPDLHSRKPNLRGLFDEVLTSGYQALEVFARNLTAGWWSWGNEVLQFQGSHHWVVED